MNKAKIITGVLAASLVIASQIPINVDAAAKSKSVYRVCSLSTEEHLYTTDKNEVKILSQNGWKNEGVVWKAPLSGTPVYRVNQPGRFHLYTTDLGEVQNLTNNHGWVVDNGGEPLFYSGGDEVVYRLYNPVSGDHILTASYDEFKSLKDTGKWTEENSGIYAVSGHSSSSKAEVPALATGSSTIENTASYYAIEGNMTLNGQGTGCHAKFVLCTATSALSFGLQYDQHAQAPYTGKTMFMSENVAHNLPGGQVYERYVEAKKGESYKVLVTLDQNGKADFYVNGALVGTQTNPALAGQTIYLRCEASARLEGDSVSASFDNIKLKGNGTYNPSKVWGLANFDTNASVHSTFANAKSGTISGTVSGIGTLDWDSAYDKVSGIVQYIY